MGGKEGGEEREEKVREKEGLEEREERREGEGERGRRC